MSAKRAFFFFTRVSLILAFVLVTQTGSFHLFFIARQRHCSPKILYRSNSLLLLSWHPQWTLEKRASGVSCPNFLMGDNTTTIATALGLSEIIVQLLGGAKATTIRIAIDGVEA